MQMWLSAADSGRWHSIYLRHAARRQRGRVRQRVTHHTTTRFTPTSLYAHNEIRLKILK